MTPLQGNYGHLAWPPIQGWLLRKVLRNRGLLIGHGRKVKCHGIFRDKLCQKTISKKQPILWECWGQILLEIYRFCADQTSIFNISLTEAIICSFNNNTLHKSEPMAKLSTSLLVPSFSNWYSCSFGMFLDKLAPLQQVNSPKRRDTYEIHVVLTFYLIRFLVNLAVFLWILWDIFTNLLEFNRKLHECAKYQKPYNNIIIIIKIIWFEMIIYWLTGC